MKKWISVAVLLGILMCLGLSTVQAQWNYVKLFPNNTLSWNTGSNNTIAIDPAGKIWMVPYTGDYDSIQVLGVYKKTWKFYVYNADGTLSTTYGPVLTFGATTDTLFTAASGYGMTTDHSGNIVVVKGSTTIRKINYLTCAQIAKKVNPLAGYTSSLATPMLDNLDEVFINSVAPTTNVGPAALASDFSSVAASVDTGMYGNYARNISVTADGNDVYVHRIGLGTVHYHSSSGTLGTYTHVDTLWRHLCIESSAWRPGTNQLWVSSGNVTSGMPDAAPYSGYAWYGFNMSNPDNPVLVDSILWNGNTGIPGDSIKNDPRPRGIAFSPNGNTAYVEAFGPSIGFCQVFSKVTAVEPVADGVVKDFALSQNYPNPFNPTTEIKFSIAKSGMTTLRVFDLLGREVAELVNSDLAVGTYRVPFDASRLSSGTYIYELRSGDARLVKKMMLMK
jgi:hypothetical protein